MKGRTIEENPTAQRLCLENEFFSWTVWWPGDKTGAENGQISQYLQRQRNPADFQALGISGAILTTAVIPSWTFHGLLEAHFHRIS